MEPATSNLWLHIDRLLHRSSPMAGSDFEPSPEIKEFLRSTCRVLVVGAGGLGCELLKDLVHVGFGNIDVIDMDTIELSNLNRQFLFRKADVKQPKAEIAAKFVNQRFRHAHITPHFARIEDRDAEFYRRFNVIVLGLDSIGARRWMNAMICSLLEYDDEGNVDPSTIIPIIDGGTEGFRGHARLIYPGMTCCFECTLDLFPPQTRFPLCTIAETPRNAAHCIAYVQMVQWEKERQGETLNADDPEHVQWVCDRARARALEFGIEGVNYSHTLGVIKNIIPAIASTNAIIAAACANEAFKIVTLASGYMKNYMTFIGDEGVNTQLVELERNPACVVCGPPMQLRIGSSATLADLLQLIAARTGLESASVSDGAGRPLYWRKPAAIEESTRENLTKPLTVLLTPGSRIAVTDPSSPKTVQCTVQFE